MLGNKYTLGYDVEGIGPGLRVITSDNGKNVYSESIMLYLFVSV